MSEWLKKIQAPEELQAMTNGELSELAVELRAFIAESVSKTGGHLASNLGTIELTLSLLHCFDFRQDKIVWDVGHQAYTYKILTGRKEAFSTLRQKGGLSGFPKREESAYDFFNTGHSSTALSAALGISRALRARHQPGRVLAVVGDGAMTGGMFYEALNNINADRDNVLLIINDNEMSISRNVGLIAKHMNNLRVSKRYMESKHQWSAILSRIPLIGPVLLSGLNRLKHQMRKLFVPGNAYFEMLGLRYYGPIDGHDIAALNRHLMALKHNRGVAVLHICTQKGRGYSQAELFPDLYHGVGPFSLGEGLLPSPEDKSLCTSFTQAFSAAIVRAAEKDERITALTAAMGQGTGLKNFADRFPERYFDVGIAEQHEMCMAAGMASAGLKPVVCVYATFLQRSLDQLIHDVALQDLPVVIAVDRTGIVGADGETHQGVYVSAMLAAAPNFTILYPSCYRALERHFEWALRQQKPVALLYPRGAEGAACARAYQEACEQEKHGEEGRVCLGCRGTSDSDQIFGLRLRGDAQAVVSILALGRLCQLALEISERLEAEGVRAAVYDMESLKPLNVGILRKARRSRLLVTLEEEVAAGGLGEQAALFLSEKREDERSWPGFAVNLHEVKTEVIVPLTKFESMREPTPSIEPGQGNGPPCCLRSFTVPDRPIPQANPSEALMDCGMDKEDIMVEIRRCLALDHPKETSGKAPNLQSASAPVFKRERADVYNDDKKARPSAPLKSAL